MRDHLKVRSHAITVAIGLLLATQAAAAGEERSKLLTAEGFPIIDGQPRLIIGMYENPGIDALLDEAVAAGLNLFPCRAKREALDRLQAHGAMGWINLHGVLATPADTQRVQHLRGVVDGLKAHPALFAWEAPDELVWNVWHDWDVYFDLVEVPAMGAAIKDAGPAADELRRLAAAMHESRSRALGDRFEEARAAFWKAAGKAPPKPGMRMDGLAAAARKAGEDLVAGLEVVRSADPSHLIWLNHAPRNSMQSLAFVNQAADMAGCDIYPVPTSPTAGHSDLENMRLSCVGEYTDRMRAAAPGKACAMVLQGFGWRDLEKPGQRSPDPAVGRRPNFHETRFMAYNALAHGATVILYYGTDFATEPAPGEPSPASAATGGKPRPQLWRDMLAIARELRALQAAIMAPEVAPPPDYEAEENPSSHDGIGLRLMLRKVDQDHVLIAVNERPTSLAFRIHTLPAALEGKMLMRLGSDESVRVVQGGFRDGIETYGVHVYATSKVFAATGGQ